MHGSPWPLDHKNIFHFFPAGVRCEISRNWFFRPTKSMCLDLENPSGDFLHFLNTNFTSHKETFLGSVIGLEFFVSIYSIKPQNMTIYGVFFSNSNFSLQKKTRRGRSFRVCIHLFVVETDPSFSKNRRKNFRDPSTCFWRVWKINHAKFRNEHPRKKLEKYFCGLGVVENQALNLWVISFIFDRERHIFPN